MSSAHRTKTILHRFVATVGSLVTLLGAHRAAQADDWTSLGLDAARSRVSAERSGVTFGSTEWRYSLPPVQDAINRVLVSSPAVADGYLVLGTTTGQVIALRAVDGTLLWRFQAGDGLHASPAIVNGTVIIPSFDQNVYALALTDGHLIWKRNLGSVELSSPVVVGDSIVVATGFPHRQVMRLALDTGETRWATPEDAMSQPSNSSAAVAGDQLILGAMAGTYYSFDLATGASRWTYKADGTVHMSAPVVIGARAYMLPGGSSHSVHAVDVATGNAAPGWPLEIPDLAPDSVGGTVQARDYAVSSPTVVGGLLVFELRTMELTDTTGLGVVDTYVLREETIAVDPNAASGSAIVWRAANGRLMTKDMSTIPAFGVCPTPLAYPTATGEMLVATASSLSPKLRVLSALDGSERWSTALSAATRGSPTFANGRLFVATDAGMVHGLLSAANAPPSPPALGAATARSLPNIAARLAWTNAIDPDGDATSYELRIDRDGEILSTWEHALVLPAGQTSATLPWTLEPDATYSYAVRARDDKGAWSEWSPLATFNTIATPAVAVSGQLAPSISDALAMAHPGDVVNLGVGTFRLTDTLRVGAGVTLSGSGPQRTVLDATGLDVGVSLQGSPTAGTRGALDHATVSGARTGVSVTDTNSGLLHNVVLRDNSVAAVSVDSGGHLELINGTLVRNGTGVNAAGLVDARNSLIVGNQTGVAATADTNVTSRYNDVHGNLVDRVHAPAGSGDLDVAVEFVDVAASDLHLKSAQPTTDKGDPEDDYSYEPAPNGGRINLGAFGNTNEAESSALAPVTSPPTPDGGATSTDPSTAAAADGSLPTPAPTTSTESGPSGATTATPSGASGCRVAGANARGSGDASPGGLVALSALIAALLGRPRRRRR